MMEAGTTMAELNMLLEAAAGCGRENGALVRLGMQTSERLNVPTSGEGRAASQRGWGDPSACWAAAAVDGVGGWCGESPLLEGVLPPVTRETHQNVPAAAFSSRDSSPESFNHALHKSTTV